MLSLPTRPLGARSDVMKDHAYMLRNGHIYTSASIARKVTMSGYAVIALTARQASFAMQVGEQIRSYRAAAIKTPIERVVYADNVRFTSFHLNPLHPMFRAFQSLGPPGIIELPRAAFVALDAALDAAYQVLLAIDEAEKLFEAVIQSASPFLPQPKPSDARIDAVLARLRLGDQVKLADLAASVDLSTGRLRHLFAETVGISLRSYSLWQKMNRVPILLANGRSFTEVAHECGFADSAHMTSAFQAIHGAPPSYFFSSGRVEFITRTKKTQPASVSATAVHSDIASRTQIERINAAGMRSI
jgi:AraC-like DNA-binding protein